MAAVPVPPWQRRLRIAGYVLLGLLLLLAVLLFAARVPDTDPVAMRAKYGGAQSQYLGVAPGLTVHVRDQGKRGGPALFLIHGSNASLHTWEPWVARLGGAYRVVSLDLQGHGLTGPHPQRCYTAACMVATVDGVRRALKIERLAIAGNSMGGWVAWNYALAHPDRTTALVLVDAAGAPPAPGTRQPDLPIGFRIVRNPVGRVLGGSITPRWVIERSLKGSMADSHQVTPAMVDRYWELLRYPGNRQATLDRFSAPRAEVTAATFAPLKMPVLVMWGREDKLIPVEQAQGFKAAIPQARVVIYDGVGHIPMEEVPDRSAADVAAFLSLLPADQPRPL